MKLWYEVEAYTGSKRELVGVRLRRDRAEQEAARASASCDRTYVTAMPEGHTIAAYEAACPVPRERW